MLFAAQYPVRRRGASRMQVRWGLSACAVFLAAALLTLRIGLTRISWGDLELLAPSAAVLASAIVLWPRFSDRPPRRDSWARLFLGAAVVSSLSLALTVLYILIRVGALFQEAEDLGDLGGSALFAVLLVAAPPSLTAGAFGFLLPRALDPALRPSSWDRTSDAA